ncbi:pilus assembly protein TadG-related protein [Trinickia sp. YCB016]
MRRVPQSSARNGMRRREFGGVSILVALSLAMLIAFVGLALDLGKLYVAKSELQNSADACALSAARDLTGATSLSIAEADGIAAAHANRVFFESTAVSATTDSTVTFSDSTSDAFESKDALTYSLANVKYVQCSTKLTGIANWLIQLVAQVPGVNNANAANLSTSSVSASAVATLGASQTTCAIPVFVCQAGTESSTAPANETYTVGEWIASKSGSTPNYGPGNFGWAALDGSNSASTIASELTGNYCSLPATGTSLGSTGNKVADSGAWNTRFGIYGTSYKDPTSGTPDYTGFDYNTTTFSAGANAYSDFVSRRTTFAPYQGDSATGQNTKGTDTASYYSTYGADRRLALAPELNCNTLAAGHSAPVVRWDCVLMLDPMDSGGGAGPVHLEYEGSSTDPSVPCATHGIPGSGSSLGPQVPMLVE